MTSSSSRSQPKRQQLDAASVGDAVSMGEAIRMSHGINISKKNGNRVLDDLSDLLDIESELWVQLLALWISSNVKSTMKLLHKQESMTSAIKEIKHDRKETQSHVHQLMEAQQNKVVDTNKHHKRKYASSLTTIIHCY